MYRLRQPTTGRKFALKVLTRGDVGSVEREYAALVSLAHPGFVRAHRVLEVGGRPALLLDWVDGPTLDRWLLLAKPTLGQKVLLLDLIVDAISHAHEHALVHRDLKPSNILLARDGTSWMPKVADLGLATFGFGPVEIGAGTPAYTAPERLAGALGDTRADVFALGCIAYELLLGVAPFSGPDRRAIWNDVVDGTYRRPLDRDPELDPAWARAIERMLARDPDQRPATASELVGELSACPPQPRPPVLRAGWGRVDWEDESTREARRQWLDSSGDSLDDTSQGGLRAALSTVATPTTLGRTSAPIASPIDARADTVPRPPPRRGRPGRPTPALWALLVALALLTLGLLGLLAVG